LTRKRNLLVLIFIGLFIIFLFCVFYNELVVRKYIIDSDELAVDDSIRIVLITDLHSHIYGKNQIKLVSLIKKQKPDIIALVVDIADDEAPIQGTKELNACCFFRIER